MIYSYQIKQLAEDEDRSYKALDVARKAEARARRNEDEAYKKIGIAQARYEAAKDEADIKAEDASKAKRAYTVASAHYQAARVEDASRQPSQARQILAACVTCDSPSSLCLCEACVICGKLEACEHDTLDASLAEAKPEDASYLVEARNEDGSIDEAIDVTGLDEAIKAYHEYVSRIGYAESQVAIYRRLA